jgi:uroporphyrinogen-III synthase
LEKAGWRVDCLPTEYSSEGLLATAPFQKVADLRCVIVRGVGGREKLAEELTARGAKVQYLEVYKRLQATTNRAVLVDCLANQQLQLVTVTSVESLQNLCAMLDTCSRALLSELPLVVVSERIKQVAEQMGFKQVAVCKQATDAAILETLTTLLNGENSGRIIRKTTR